MTHDAAACAAHGCGETLGTVRYLVGYRCPAHAPAALAGRVVPTPDPAMTADGLAGRLVTRAQPVEYGTATTDPLGRTVPGHSKNGFIPSHQCTACRTIRPVNHKGDHTT